MYQLWTVKSINAIDTCRVRCYVTMGVRKSPYPDGAIRGACEETRREAGVV